MSPNRSWEELLYVLCVSCFFLFRFKDLKKRALTTFECLKVDDVPFSFLMICFNGFM